MGGFVQPLRAPLCAPAAVMREVEESARVIDELVQEISRELLLGASVAYVTGKGWDRAAWRLHAGLPRYRGGRSAGATQQVF